MSLDVEAALAEIVEKTDSEMEIETAWKWASRAVACFMLYTQGQATNLRWFLRGLNYKHEALEHAALAEDGGVTLKAIENALQHGSGGEFLNG